MASSITGEFETRRSVELAVEHIVQEHGVARDAVQIRPKGQENTVGTKPSGSDAKASPANEGQEELNGPVIVSVKLSGTNHEAIGAALKEAGATNVQTN